jgi:hypothetical protein
MSSGVFFVGSFVGKVLLRGSGIHVVLGLTGGFFKMCIVVKNMDDNPGKF